MNDQLEELIDACSKYEWDAEIFKEALDEIRQVMVDYGYGTEAFTNVNARLVCLAVANILDGVE